MTLANEFQQKAAAQNQQLRAQALPQSGPKIHPEDTMIVKNILIGDNHEMQDVIPYANARQSIDPSTGAQHFVNQIETNIFENVWNTSDYFEVRWDGRPHRIKPGETRRMPRYLADHFAKYLIDYILSAREENEKLTGLVKNRLERQKLYDQIIVGVDSYYNGDGWDYERQGVIVEQKVEELNKPDNSLNLGQVPNTAMGYGLSDAAPKPIETITPELPSSIDPNMTHIPNTPVSTIVHQVSPSAPQGIPTSRQELIDSKSRNQLIAEAKTLGIELKGQENKSQIFDLITNF